MPCSVYVPLFAGSFASRPIGALAYLCLRHRPATLVHPPPLPTYKAQANTPTLFQPTVIYRCPSPPAIIKISIRLRVPSYPSPTAQNEPRRSQSSILRVRIPSPSNPYNTINLKFPQRHIRLLRQQTLVRKSQQPSRRSAACRFTLDRHPLHQHQHQRHPVLH
jgi:hypothetical protein